MLNQHDEVLGRLDERTLSILENMKMFRGDITNLQNEIKKTQDSINNKVDTLQADFDTKIDGLKREIEEKYVTKERFTPIEKVVYGVVGLILTMIFSALVTIVIKGGVPI